MTDLIPRAAAIAACQVGPSDEWSRSTKSGYSQASTDCTMNILRIPAAQVVKPLPHGGHELDAALSEYTPGIDRAVRFVTIDQVDALAEFYLQNRSALIDTPPAVSDDVAALVGASEIMAAALGALNAQAHRTMTGGYGHLIVDAAHALRDYRAALAKLKGGAQ